MSYFYKFKDSDKITNLVKTYPKVSFVFYSGSSYYNNRRNISGSFSSSILGIPEGHISLYEQNIDRSGTLNYSTPAANASGLPQDPFGFAVSSRTDPTDYYIGPNPGTSVFIIKNGTRINFKSVSYEDYNTLDLGDVLFTDYPLSSSVQKYYYASGSAKYVKSFDGGGVPGAEITGSVTYLYALKNTLNYYKLYNTNYAFSSSLRDLGASASCLTCTPIEMEPGALDVGLLTIPSIMYGDTIKKGSINLLFYVTGTLVGELRDTNRNGDLIQVGPYGSPGSGGVAGVALYNEGALVLTGSWDLSSGAHTENYGTANNYPTWVNFAQTITASSPRVMAPSSSCILNYSASHKIPTRMLFATAPKNKVNHSNNPTYRDYGTTLAMVNSSIAYKQNFKARIKNTVSSSYADPTGSFQKITYISRIGVYDKNKNLIGIAKLAKPVKKLEERELTFKLKIDI